MKKAATRLSDIMAIVCRLTHFTIFVNGSVRVGAALVDRDPLGPVVVDAGLVAGANDEALWSKLRHAVGRGRE